MSKSVNATDVGVVLNGLRILREVSLGVEEARLVGLVGPNGSGKTTLIRTINGLLEPSEGEVEVEGDGVGGLSSEEVSRRVATVPQNTDINFEFSAEDLVEMGRHPHTDRFGRDRESGVVESAMRQTEVEGLSGRSIQEVSGGERQRVLLARGLAQETPVLLLDEPTANLDINHQVKTLELVRSLVDEEGKSAIVAIHDVNLAARYCDEIVLLSDGGVVCSGDPEDVLTRRNVEEVFGTTAAVLRNPVTGSVEVTPMKRSSDRDTSVHVVGGGGSVKDLLRELWQRGYEVSVGALHEGDMDLVTARALGIDALVVDAYSRVDKERVEEYVDSADVVVVGDVDVGRENLPNLEAVLGAESVVVVEERGFEERNHAGERGLEVYTELRRRGIVIGRDGVVDCLERLVGVSGIDGVVAEGETD